MFPRSLLGALALLAFVSPRAYAQQEDPPPTHDPHPYTLHVYTNLVQVPTLVLGENRKPLPAIPRKDFAITLDGGPPFAPTQMRMQGDDPLSLAILLDVSDKQHSLAKVFADTLAAVTPLSLRPHDHVSIYAVDCKLFRSSFDVPADPETLSKGVSSVLALPALHNGKDKPACGSTLRLWEAVFLVSRQLADLPGRRAIFLATQANDHSSALHVTDVARYAAARGIAVFALRNKEEWDRDHIEHNPLTDRTGRPIGGSSYSASEDPLTLLCETSGGLVLPSTSSHLQQNLQDLVTLLRNRYILEYPRPKDTTAGLHSLDVRLPNQQAFIRPTGVTTTIEDPALANDPNVVPVAPSPAVTGKRRHLDPN